MNSKDAIRKDGSKGLKPNLLHSQVRKGLLILPPMAKIDRLSALPDNILTCNIFSHLSLTDIFRTSLLSTRWRFLCKQIPHLHFSDEFIDSVERKYNLNDIIDNIILGHYGHIEKFSINTYSDILQTHHAALKEVKHMSLRTYSADIPPYLFACRLLTDLELHNFRFTGIPIEFDGFRSLQSLSLAGLEDFTEDGLKQFIGLCPFLHKLVLSSNWRLINLKIQAPNLDSLKILHFFQMESLTVDCPHLVELEIENCERLLELKMNSCVLFHELHTSDVQTPKKHPMLNLLRKLSVKACNRVRGVTLLATLGCFCNLEEVHIQISEDNHYSEQERAKGELIADSTLPNLKRAYVDISSAMKKEEGIMLSFLVNNAPSLNTIIVTLPYCPKHIHDKEFRNIVLGLQQIYEKVNIRIDIDEYRRDATCRGTYDEYSDRSDEYIYSSESYEYQGSDHFGSDDDALSGPLNFSPSIFVDSDALNDEC